MSSLNVDADRLWDSLIQTAEIGGTPDGGIARLTLSDDDRRVRDWLAQQCAALEMSLQVDEVGNMFVTRPGRRADLPAFAMGSHLDTKPTVGKFDGVLVALGGLEVLRTLDASGYQTEVPLMLVNWINEEGSRFARAMLGAGVWAGVCARDNADARQDADGASFGASLDRISKAHPGAVGTIGHLEVSPNSHNVIPEEVRATIDLRHPSDAILELIEAEIAALVAKAAAEVGLEQQLVPVSPTAALAFDADGIAAVRAGVRAAGFSTREIISGAGHNAAHTAAVAPTTMIFVPCAGGLSHNPAESTEPEECAPGAQVLLETVLGYDRRRAKARKEVAT